MIETIADCQVLLAGGMGWGAYENIKRYNIEPVVTDVKDIDQAVKLHLDGKLKNLTELLH
jgi:predicted Fe-Mo cluster-binding NifX family protein